MKTPDAGVIVLMAWTQKFIPADVYVNTGAGEQKRILDVKVMALELSEKLLDPVIGFHIFTGMLSLSGCFN